MTDQNSGLELDKKATLYWEEWKYRHDIYWKSVNLWGGAIIFLLVAPFTEFANVENLGKYILVFPVAGFFMSFISGWQLSAEIARLQNVTKSLREILPVHTITPKTLRDRIIFYSIGKFITRLFFFGFSTLSVIDGLILLNLIDR